MSIGEWFPMLLKFKQSWTAGPIMVIAQCFLKMWRTTVPATQCHNPEDLSHMSKEDVPT